MRKHLRTLLAAVSISAIAGVAYGDSPKFHFADASVLDNLDLQVVFKETGLGTTVTSANIAVFTNATVTCHCVNSGGQCPNAANKSTNTAEVSKSGIFPVSNGQTSGAITVQPPVCAPTKTACPKGQTLQPTQVSYAAPSSVPGLTGPFAGIIIEDVTESDSAVTTPPSVSGPLTPVCP